MKIVIPSFNRYNTINNNTLAVLKINKIPNNIIYIFVSSMVQYLEYKKYIPDDINLIIGVEGIKNQRNFISNFFEIDEVIISIDDDITKITIKNDKPLLDVFNELCSICNGLIGFSPVYNEYFSFKLTEYQTGLYFCVGCFFIYKNRKYNTTCDFVEDYELSLMYYKADNFVIRYNSLIFKTKYWNTNGGISFNRNIETYYNTVNKLIYKYSDYCSYKYKFVKYFNCKIPTIKFHYKQKSIILLPTLYDGIFNKVYELLSKITIPYKDRLSGRKGFLKHRAVIFGLSKGKKNGTIGLSRSSLQYPEIWEEILRIGDIIVPFNWCSCYLNNNMICPPHYDSNNIGNSLLVSFGNYTGCNIVIDKIKYNANYNPIIFNGSKLEHYNTDDLIGTKYSLIYYNK